MPDDWKSIKEIWVDFNSSTFSQYDIPHNIDDEDVQRRIAKWADANSGTAINNTPSVSLLKTLGFELIGTENVSFYKDTQGNDIVFEGGIFKLDTIC